jgi:hypothetical protein
VEEDSNRPSDNRQGLHGITHLNLSSLTDRAGELNTDGVTPAELWLQVEQLLLSMYHGRSLTTASAELSFLAAAALLEHDRRLSATTVDLPGWQNYRDENGPWPEHFPATAAPVATEDPETWERLANALENKHICSVIPLGAAPNRLARLAAGAITCLALATAESRSGP